MAVGWYLRFSLSYRDVEELLIERGLDTDHITIWRWVQRYAPELERRLRAHLKSTNRSWRVDETFVRVKVSGLIFTELLIRRAPRLTFYCQLNAMPLLPSASFKKHYVHPAIPLPASSTLINVRATRQR
jgi:hypothetical protein